MLKVNDFKAKGYTATEMLPYITCLVKDITDSNGICYTIKVILEDDLPCEPEVSFESSTVLLKTDERTSIEEIEEFYSNMWSCLGKPYKEIY